MHAHAQGNGLDERFNQTLQNMIVKSIRDKQDEWDNCIDSCVYAYNTAVHESSLYTPFELMFGRRAVLPVDIEMDDKPPENLLANFNQETDLEAIQAISSVRSGNLLKAKENIKKAQEKQKKYYDRKHAKPDAFAVGEKVLIKDFLRKKRAGGKLDTRFIGPYLILKKVGNGTYSLRKLYDPNGVIKKVSGAHMKLYIDSASKHTR